MTLTSCGHRWFLWYMRTGRQRRTTFTEVGILSQWLQAQTIKWGTVIVTLEQSAN